ncbi:replication initiation protein [Elizabethkingia ursingii]
MKTISINALEKENKIISISNAIAKARYNLSLPTQKILIYMISKIAYEEKQNGIFLETIKCSFNEIEHFCKISGRENSHDYKDILRKFVKEMHGNSIDILTVSEKGKEIWESWSWSQYAKIDDLNSEFHFKFNQEVAPLFLSLQVKFFTSNVIEYLRLSSYNAISLYMLFRANEYPKSSIKTYSISELKKYLGVEEKYKEWSELKRVIIDPCITQLNKETNYFFSYEAKRIGRSIGKIEVRVIDKKEKKEFSDYFLEKIQEFLQKEKKPSSIRKNFNLMKYEYLSDINALLISFKDKKTEAEYLNTIFDRGGKTVENILSELLDSHIAGSKEAKQYFRSMFREGFKIYYDIIPDEVKKKRTEKYEKNRDKKYS